MSHTVQPEPLTFGSLFPKGASCTLQEEVQVCLLEVQIPYVKPMGFSPAGGGCRRPAVRCDQTMVTYQVDNGLSIGGTIDIDIDIDNVIDIFF